MGVFSNRFQIDTCRRLFFSPEQPDVYPPPAQCPGADSPRHRGGQGGGAQRQGGDAQPRAVFFFLHLLGSTSCRASDTDHSIRRPRHAHPSLWVVSSRTSQWLSSAQFELMCVTPPHAHPLPRSETPFQRFSQVFGLLGADICQNCPIFSAQSGGRKI